MKRIILRLLGSVALPLLVAFSGLAQMNPNPTLKIGDPAPPLKFQTWISGQPVTAFKKGQVYVVDFWATWCGGCIASFRHISDVADKYKDKVHFISVDSYEDVDEEMKGKDPEPIVKDFLKTPRGQKLKLNVAVDGATNTMFATWVKVLRRGGFPTTFVIDQEGKIAWVDVNLDHLDWVLGQVLAKKWDRAKAAEIMKQKDALEDMWITTVRKKDGDKTKDLQAVVAASETFEKQFPDRKDAVAFYKFFALLELDVNKITPVLEQMANDPRSRYINLSDAAGLTLRKPNLSRETYLAVAKVEERVLSNEYPEMGYGGTTVRNYQELADTYQKAGDPVKALDYTEKALELAQQQQFPREVIDKLYANFQKLRQVNAP